MKKKLKIFAIAALPKGHANIEPSQYAVNPHAISVKDIFLSGVDYELLKTVF